MGGGVLIIRCVVGCGWVGVFLTHRVAGWGMEMRRRGERVVPLWLFVGSFFLLFLEGWDSRN